MHYYRTRDGQDYTIPDIGRTVNGEIRTDRIIENPNFELIQDTPEQIPEPILSTPEAPAPVIATSEPTVPQSQPVPEAAPAPTPEPQPPVSEPEPTQATNQGSIN